MGEENILHLDLKPANIMLTYDYKIKIIDFGTSGSVGDKIEFRCTMNYCNKDIATKTKKEGEINEIKKETLKLDLWCAGCILFELYNREFLFRSLDAKDHREKKLPEFFKNQKEGIPVFKNGETPTDEEKAMNDFFNYIMKESLDSTPTVEQALKHPWLKDIDDYMNAEKMKKVLTQQKGG